jgi:competence protein ComEA
MKLNIEPVRSWFGFTRRERRSSFILLIIMVFIVSLRYAVPEKNIAIEDITASISGIGGSFGLSGRDTSSVEQLFLFDPNRASYDTLIMLGLASKEANTLIRYRNKGGKFRNPSDINKVYGITEENSEKLIPFVKMAGSTAEEHQFANSTQKRPILDINICDSASLVRLPGIGPVLSARIIKYRHLLGGFARIDQLKEVYGLPEETFDIIKGRLYADSSAVVRININSAGYKELSRFPYFEKYEVTAILKYKELNVRVGGISDLIENKLLTKEKAYKVRPYLCFGD